MYSKRHVGRHRKEQCLHSMLGTVITAPWIGRVLPLMTEFTELPQDSASK